MARWNNNWWSFSLQYSCDLASQFRAMDGVLLFKVKSQKYLFIHDTCKISIQNTNTYIWHGVNNPRENWCLIPTVSRVIWVRWYAGDYARPSVFTQLLHFHPKSPTFLDCITIYLLKFSTITTVINTPANHHCCNSHYYHCPHRCCFHHHHHLGAADITNCINAAMATAAVIIVIVIVIVIAIGIAVTPTVNTTIAPKPLPTTTITTTNNNTTTMSTTTMRQPLLLHYFLCYGHHHYSTCHHHHHHQRHCSCHHCPHLHGRNDHDYRLGCTRSPSVWSAIHEDRISLIDC